MRESTFTAVVIGSAAIDLLVAMLCLTVGRRGRPIGLRRVAGAFAATTIGFAAKVPAMAALGVGAFGFICLIYVDLVVVVPLIGLAILAGPWPRSRAVARLSGLGLGLAAVGLYATYWEPFNLRVEAATLALRDGRAGRMPLRVAVLSDIQVRRVTDYERGAVDRLMALRPDLILISGDVFQGDNEAFDRERGPLRDLLGRLDAPGGVYLVQGDVDRGPGRAARLVEGTGIRLLFNEVHRVEVGDRKVTIGGVELEYGSAEARRVVDRLESDADLDDIRIVLAHRPDVVSLLGPGSRVDLVVAGHTHGGQVVVPGFGPLMTLSDVPRSVAAGGLHRLEGNAIYVSRGVGCERAQAPRIRFLCPPELSLLTLETRP